jgi:phosphatidylglycerophosphate synthase
MGYSIVKEQTVVPLFLLILVSFMDALDGALASNANSQSEFGKFYDAFADRLVEGIIYLSLAVAYPWMALLCFVTLILSYLTSYMGGWESRAKYLGIGCRAERMIVLIVSFAIGEIYYGLIIISAISTITIFQRFYFILKISRP